MSANMELALLTALCVFVPYLITRRREVDANGNPTLRLWGWCALATAVGVFCAWKGIVIARNVSCDSCPHDPVAAVGLSVFSFAASACFFCVRITLLPDRIEYTSFPFLTASFPLKE